LGKEVDRAVRGSVKWWADVDVGRGFGDVWDIIRCISKGLGIAAPA
jgi:hypothetical protein